MFRNREDAASQLASRLSAYQDQRPLVLAIPRGAVPMGKILARQLKGDFDVVLVRKLHAPFQPELAIGAIDESGWRTIAPHAADVGADAGYIEEEARRQLRLLHERRALYSPQRTPIDPAGRVVIVVDDGLATGATMIAALHSVRRLHPARLVCAVPVASPESLHRVTPLADEVVCLHAPEHFQAVGQFYLDFPQVEDDEVIRQLRT
jgi:predicted phosphoribosyltransferase